MKALWMSFKVLPKQTEWFIENASAQNRLALVKRLLTARLLASMPLTGRLCTNSLLDAQKYQNR